MNTRQQFLETISANPMDPDLREIFADWLEEQEEAEAARHQRNAAHLCRNDVHHVRNDAVFKAAANISGHTGTRWIWAARLNTPFTPPHGFGEWDGEGNRTSCFVLKSDDLTECSWDLIPDAPMPPEFLFVIYNQYGEHADLMVCGHPDTLAALLPPGTDLSPPRLSWAEKVVLIATRAYKSSYGGDRDYRKHEAKRITGITGIEWEDSKERLIARKLLTKTGAISPAGRSSIGWTDLYGMKRPVGANDAK